MEVARKRVPEKLNTGNVIPMVTVYIHFGSPCF